MCLKGTYTKGRIGKNLFDAFSIHNGLKQGDALLSLLFNFAYAMPLGRSKEMSKYWK
jgi:hypothetical protein